MKLVDNTYYYQFILDYYGDESIQCSNVDLNVALLRAENKVLSWANGSYCWCSQDDDHIKNAICIYAYDYIKFNFENITTSITYEDNAFLYLKNNCKILVDSICL